MSACICGWQRGLCEVHQCVVNIGLMLGVASLTFSPCVSLHCVCAYLSSSPTGCRWRMISASERDSKSAKERKRGSVKLGWEGSGRKKEEESWTDRRRSREKDSSRWSERRRATIWLSCRLRGQHQRTGPDQGRGWPRADTVPKYTSKHSHCVSRLPVCYNPDSVGSNQRIKQSLLCESV